MAGEKPIRKAVFASGYGDQVKFICELSGKKSPKVLVFATAARDNPEVTGPIVEAFQVATRKIDVVKIWEEQPKSVAALRKKILSSDIVWFSGGMTERLADKISFYHLADTFREAYRRGTVMTGTSAGCIILSHAGYNDFTDGRYDFIAGMGMLPVFFCPHYQGAPWKGFDKRLARETYPGTPSKAWALEDGAMVVFRNEKPSVKIFAEGTSPHRYVRKDGAWTKLD